MSLIEAIWSMEEEGELLLWAERKVVETNAETHYPLLNSEEYYPYSLNADELTEKLTSLEVDNISLRDIKLYLPVKEDRIINRNFAHSADIIEKRLFKIKASAFDALDAINILTSVSESEEGEIKLSDSFLFWREVSKLVLELLTKGQYLPGISRRK